MAAMPGSVRIVEVGPRDGLQNEAKTLSPQIRAELIRRLAACGLRTIEAGAFVSPKWVPQMADTAQVLALLADGDSGADAGQGGGQLRHPVLVPNLRGAQDALAAGAGELAVFTAASEQFCQRNTNCSIAQSLERFAPVLALAADAAVPVRGYVSCVMGCPYQGEVAHGAVRDLSLQLLDMGCYEVSLGDTTGIGTAGAVTALLQLLLADIPARQLAVHFHDTWGQALANIHAALQCGIAVVDSSVAGLGGCPYAKGASGNVATEDLVYMLDGLGIQHGADLQMLAATGAFITAHLGCETRSRAARALLAARPAAV